jgi:hypothetical protein
MTVTEAITTLEGTGVWFEAARAAAHPGRVGVGRSRSVAETPLNRVFEALQPRLRRAAVSVLRTDDTRREENR